MRMPRHLFHLAELSNWPSIQRDGLLSASRLIHAADLRAAERDCLEREQRLQHTTLPSGVCIRDQRPMPASSLAKCLLRIAPSEWYALLNARVFFWVYTDRLNRQRAACGPRPQVVLTIDATSL